jgi:ferredoxin-NADP reductase
MKATITHIEYAASKEVTFVRCKPEQVFSFKEWQFMMVASDHIHEWLGKPLKKPYSIATTNDELQTQWTIWFVVKKVCEWFMSEYLTDWINVGDVLHLQWPAWHMYGRWEQQKYLLVSVGSGLSPMVWMYNSLIAKSTTQNIAMLYGERYGQHVLSSTVALFKQSPTNSHNRLFLSREADSPLPQDRTDELRERWILQDWYVQNGLESALTFLWTKNISVFLCGHPAMVDDVRAKLVEYGIEGKNIQFEKY